jgi:hypothetical protein
LFAEISVAVNNAFVVLIVAALIVGDSYTMLKLAIVSDVAVVTFFLQVGSFHRANGSGRGKCERQHAGDEREKADEGSLHSRLLFRLKN